MASEQVARRTGRAVTTAAPDRGQAGLRRTPMPIGIAKMLQRWLSDRTKPLAAAAILLGSLILFFFHLGSYGLWHPDEARYAEISREMLATGDWIVPHLNYVAYVEKPPLLYWLGAAALRLFGINEFAARLPVALCGFAGVAAVFLFGCRTLGKSRAILAAAILATSPLYAVMAQVLSTDMVLTAALSAAFLSLYYLVLENDDRWLPAFYAAVSLGVLAKGPVAIVLPVASGIVFLSWRGHLRSGLRRLRLGRGLGVVALATGWWFVAMELREPGFFGFYFVGEHLQRYLKPGYSSHPGTIFYYVPVLIGGLGVWSAVGAVALWRAEMTAPRAFFLAAAGTVFVFFSLSGSKLIPYLLPAFPPLALLIGDSVVSALERDAAAFGRRLLWISSLIVLSGAIVVGMSVAAPLFKNPYISAIRGPLAAVGIVLLLGGTCAIAAFSRGLPRTGVTVLAILSALALVAGSYGRLHAEPLRSYARFARRVAREAPGATLICYHRYVQALSFYCQRRIVLVGPLSELRFGAERDPEAKHYFFHSDDDFVRLWNAAPRVVVAIDAADLKRLAPRLGCLSVIASERRKRAVMKCKN